MREVQWTIIRKEQKPKEYIKKSNRMTILSRISQWVSPNTKSYKQSTSSLVETDTCAQKTRY